MRIPHPDKLSDRPDVARVRVEKPRLGVPVTLIVDDPTPLINPLYYYRLQVDGKNYEQHVQAIPFDFLLHFVAVCKARGIRGKFSILPYPAGLGSILTGWEGGDLQEITRWLDVVRRDLVPHFDITPEILTHTRALDLATGTMVEQSEQAWMADQSPEGLAAYMSAATEMLHAAGFVASGITQPVSFAGSRPAYAQATLEAIRRVGGPPVTFFFLDEHLEGPPFWEPEVVLLDRERGEAVVSIANTCPDYCWNTQQPAGRPVAEAADLYITADGTRGRLPQLVDGDGWLITVCHWQSIYSDGTRAGLLALDEAFARLERRVGPRLLWLKNSEIAQYRAATDGCDISVRPSDGGFEVVLDATIPCPDFTCTVLPADPAWRCNEVLYEGDDGARVPVACDDSDGLLPPGQWRATEEGVAVCLQMRRGRQVVRLG